MLEREKIKKILVINLVGIGDLIMSTPAIKALRRQFQDAKICLLVYSFNKELVENSPYVDNIFVLDRRLNMKDIDTLFKLRKINFDIAINLYNVYSKRGAINMATMLKIIKAKKTLGRDTDGRGFFYDYKIPERFDDLTHQVERMLAVVESLGAKEEDKRLDIWISEEKHNNLDTFLKNTNISKEDFIIGLNPGSIRPSHRWPIKNFAILANALKNNYKAKVVVTGNKKEIGLARRLKQLSGEDIFISSGEFSLSDLVNFIRVCNIYISNDTGPMHIANALGVPLVAITGSGSKMTYPYLKEKTIILKKDIDCSPCYKNYCWRLDCLKAISPEDVMKAVKTLLK